MMAVFGTLGTCCSYLPILYRARNKKIFFEKKWRDRRDRRDHGLIDLIYIDF